MSIYPIFLVNCAEKLSLVLKKGMIALLLILIRIKSHQLAVEIPPMN